MSIEKPDNVVRDIENYLAHQRIDKIVKEMVVSVLHEKPESVEQHMLKHLLTRTAEADGEVAASSTDDGVHVAFVHKEEAKQQYLISKGVHELFAELLQRLAQEQPEDVAGFIASHLTQQ
ncbi:hypothetical protein PLESTB_000132300 [Pleodorina starrii]|uniref:Uncharacterized protein n=1 Tax=Pleodorina starrii TaxID=330485 RepID=A0A9W6BBJ2_9CHLO|nr:hypothetical protein PLESTM_000491300 [Pleodorina starrii]GLC48745.1 hypothetical protein PLESTB_000132300 [Pleodorina starrii]GLC74294.1 hypothetical protein PLESTF_001486000 [Pleodorina starrii]